MHLYSFGIILQGAYLALSLDIKEYGKANVKDFYRRLADDSITDELLISMDEAKPKIKYVTGFEPEEKNKNDTLLEYVEHIKAKGVKGLKYLGRNILKEMNVEKNTTLKINAMTNDYIITIQNYFDTIEGMDLRIIVDEEFMFLNMLETACRHYYKQQIKLLSDEAMAAKRKTDSNSTAQENSLFIEKISKQIELIYKQSLNFKRQEMEYICSQYEICRPFPAFTDYLRNLIVEVLSLPDDKETIFIKVLADILEENKDFISLTAYKEDEKAVPNKTIFEEIQHLCQNKSVTDVLLLVKGILNQRFEIARYEDAKIKTKVQAARILLDMVDKSFHYNYDGDFLVELDTTLETIKRWGNGEKPLNVVIIEQFINNVFKTINSSYGSMKSALIDIVLRGKTSYTMDLVFFSDGSKGVFLISQKKEKKTILNNL